MTYTADFKPGSVWVASGGGKVTVLSATFTGGNPEVASDWKVEYSWEDRGKTVAHTKDGWNFQVRYQPLQNS